MAAPSKFLTVTGLQAACQNFTGSAYASQGDFLVFAPGPILCGSSEANSSIEFPKF
jgi:hypothetical protein